MEAGTRHYSRETRLKVRTLYLIKGLPPSEIAEIVGIRAQSVSNLVAKNGWARERQEREARALARAEDRAAHAADEFVQSVVTQSQELAEKGFHHARNAEDGKEFAMAAKGTQVFVQLARQGMGLDAGQTAAANRAGCIALVFGQPFAEAQPEEKRAEAVDVQTSPVSTDVILDFDESQQGAEPDGESDALIESASQLVGNG